MQRDTDILLPYYILPADIVEARTAVNGVNGVFFYFTEGAAGGMNFQSKIVFLLSLI